MSKGSNYSVIVNVAEVSDVDEAAEQAYQRLRTGETPDAVIPELTTDELSKLIATKEAGPGENAREMSTVFRAGHGMTLSNEEKQLIRQALHEYHLQLFARQDSRQKAAEALLNRFGGPID